MRCPSQAEVCCQQIPAGFELEKLLATLGTAELHSEAVRILSDSRVKDSANSSLCIKAGIQ